MAKLLRLRRGTDTQHTTFTGAEGEVTVNTTNDSLHVHDGTTAGGRELARADLSNLPAGTIDNADISGSAAIANSKLATSGVTAGTYGSSSAIPAITVNDRGIVTSATTSAIDSTAITNGTSNVSVAASGDITATRSGTQRLAVTSTGINVTGTVTCDGLTSDGQMFINLTNDPQLVIKDNDNSGAAAECALAFTDSNNNTLSRVGVLNNTDNTLDLFNTQNAGIRFSTVGTNRCAVDNNGHFVPLTDDTYDLGTSSNQWRNGYFDGTVYCDGIEIDNAIIGTAQATTLRFTESGTTVGLVSSASFGFHDGVGVALGTQNNEPIKFGTNGIFRAQFDNAGHFVPNGGNNYDLGDVTNRWRNVYTNDLNLSNEGGANDVDGTWGSWTIQEGEDDLFLLNRRNGKKYKFNLSEVN